MPLDTELATYLDVLPTLAKDNGKYVLIKGETVVGVFGTYEDALKVGYHEFGLEPFLVRQIQTEQQVQFVTRLFDVGCHT